MTSTESHPSSWTRLYGVAEAQHGHFTGAQAAEIGVSQQLLQKHLHAGRLHRVRHGIYRLVHFPPMDHEELVVLWLWSTKACVFSHETALLLHDLSDALPSWVHLTLPSSWKRRRLRVPDHTLLAYDDVPTRDRGWMGAVPVTTPARTLFDCLYCWLKH